MADIKDNDLEKAAGGMSPKYERRFGGGSAGLAKDPRELAGGLVIPQAEELRVLLTERLPAGTVLDEEILAKLAGGLAADRLNRPNLADGLAAPLAEELGLPDKFASTAEMEAWFAEHLGGGFGGGLGGGLGGSDSNALQ